MTHRRQASEEYRALREGPNSVGPIRSVSGLRPEGYRVLGGEKAIQIGDSGALAEAALDRGLSITRSAVVCTHPKARLASAEGCAYRRRGVMTTRAWRYRAVETIAVDWCPGTEA
jgi:hypothetical protein